MRRSVSLAEYHGYLRNLGQPIPEEPKKLPKFRNQKVHLHGFVFDSKKEAEYYMECRYRLCAGLIRDLYIHTRFPLVIPIVEAETVIGYKIWGYYVDDFDYVNLETGEWEVVDVKSRFTVKLPSFQKKKEWMWRQYGIRIKEIIR